MLHALDWPLRAPSITAHNTHLRHCAAAGHISSLCLLKVWNFWICSHLFFFFFCSFPVKAQRWGEITHKVVIRQGNAFCLQNLGACCGCLELFVDSPVSYPLHLLLSWAHMVGSPLCMPGLSWETEAYMAQWKPLTRAALPSIFRRASPTSTSFLFFSFFFFTDIQVVGFITGAWKLWITER